MDHERDGGFVCAYFSKTFSLDFLAGIIVGMICSASWHFSASQSGQTGVCRNSADHFRHRFFLIHIPDHFRFQKLPPLVDSLTKFDIPLLSSIPFIGYDIFSSTFDRISCLYSGSLFLDCP
jgi:hypothetical protein